MRRGAREFGVTEWVPAARRCAVSLIFLGLRRPGSNAEVYESAVWGLYSSLRPSTLSIFGLERPLLEVMGPRTFAFEKPTVRPHATMTSWEPAASFTSCSPSGPDTCAPSTPG